MRIFFFFFFFCLLKIIFLFFYVCLSSFFPFVRMSWREKFCWKKNREKEKKRRKERKRERETIKTEARTRYCKHSFAQQNINIYFRLFSAFLSFYLSNCFCLFVFKPRYLHRHTYVVEIVAIFFNWFWSKYFFVHFFVLIIIFFITQFASRVHSDLTRQHFKQCLSFYNK